MTTKPTDLSTPLIGLPCRQETGDGVLRPKLQAQSESYLVALNTAGGIPFLIPLILPEADLRRLFELADGILLAGGGDIDPQHFGQPPHPRLSNVQPARDRVELQLARWAAAEGKPLLAICRGIQVLAVSAGGSLCQDVPTLKPEAACHRYGYLDQNTPAVDALVHRVDLVPGSRLAEIAGANSIPVNSLHHQAVEGIPPPYRVTGYSEDGLVEGLELPDHPFYCGVQWHPELIRRQHPAADRLFAAFVEACRGGRAGMGSS